MQKRYLMFFIITVVCSMTFLFSDAQYYYKDLWNQQQQVKEFGIWKAEKIHTVSVTSLEGDGSPSEGFFLEKKIDKNYTKSEAFSRSFMTQPSMLTSRYSPNGLLLEIVDSSENSVSHSIYQYDEKGRVIEIKTINGDPDDSSAIAESHHYLYNAAGNLEKMDRSKNNIPLSSVNFTIDDKGNVIEEEEMTKGVKGKKFYYYYDDKNHLTDVVQYNDRAKRLLPNFMYEYSSNGMIKQLIATEEGGSNYFIWRYTYNDKGLRETERCLSKQRKLLGSIEYSYK